MISLLGLSHLPAVHVVIVAALATDSIAAAAVLHALWFEVSSIFKLGWFCAKTAVLLGLTGGVSFWGFPLP